MSKIIGYKTVSNNLASWYDPAYKFKVGKTFEIKNAPKLGGAPCGPGLHFCEKEKDIPSYCNNHDNYTLLRVEADEKDVLGRDASKTRVRKLKILEIIRMVGESQVDYQPLFAKIIKDLASFQTFNPTKSSALTVALNKLKVIDKSIKGVHITDNVYEANYWIEEVGLEWIGSSQLISQDNIDDYMYDDRFKLNFRMPVHDDQIIIESQYNIIGDYLHWHSLAKTNKIKANEKHEAKSKAAYDVLKLGAIPLGMIGSTLIVFTPKATKTVKKSRKKRK